MAIIVEQTAIPNVKAQTPSYFGVGIASPANESLYTVGLLNVSLEVIVKGVESPQVFMNYSLDGVSNGSIPYLVDSVFNYAPFLTNWFDGSTTLQASQGKHNLTITTGINSIPLNVTTIHFTVNFFEPPIISNLSIQNKTYKTNSLPLDFTTSEPTAWIGYSLDNSPNISVTGNTTLSNLTDGSHTLKVYANDTVGNVGWTSTVFFTVDTSTPSPSPSPATTQTPSPSPSQQPTIATSIATSPTPIEETGNANIALEIAGVIMIAIVAVGLLVYFRRRRG